MSTTMSAQGSVLWPLRETTGGWRSDPPRILLTSPSRLTSGAAVMRHPAQRAPSGEGPVRVWQPPHVISRGSIGRYDLEVEEDVSGVDARGLVSHEANLVARGAEGACARYPEQACPGGRREGVAVNTHGARATPAMAACSKSWMAPFPPVRGLPSTTHRSGSGSAAAGPTTRVVGVQPDDAAVGHRAWLEVRASRRVRPPPCWSGIAGPARRSTTISVVPLGRSRMIRIGWPPTSTRGPRDGGPAR